MAKRPDRIVRVLERVERNECCPGRLPFYSLLVNDHAGLREQSSPVERAKGAERYDGFIENLQGAPPRIGCSGSVAVARFTNRMARLNSTITPARSLRTCATHSSLQYFFASPQDFDLFERLLSLLSCSTKGNSNEDAPM